MKYLFFAYLFLVSAFELSAQIGKPIVDTNSLGRWPVVASPAISDNGQYLFYMIYNVPEKGRNTLVVQSTVTDWNRKFAGARNAKFLSDNHRLIFEIGTDSLVVLELGSEDVLYLPGATGYKIPEGWQEWLAYRRTTGEKAVVLHNLFTHKEEEYKAVATYVFDMKGKTLLLQIESQKEPTPVYSLQLVNLMEGKIREIWKGTKTNYPAFDTSGNELTFIINGGKENELGYYRNGMEKAIVRINRHSSGIGDGLTIANSAPQFNITGDQIFFKLQPIDSNRVRKKYGVSLDVWSYKDVSVQPFQLLRASYPVLYTAVINKGADKVIRLEQENETMSDINSLYDTHFVIVKRERGEPTESFWNRSAQPSIFLVSTRDGSRRLLKQHLTSTVEQITLSPFGKWALYYDPLQMNYFCYETATGITRNITKGIRTNWIKKSIDRPGLTGASLTCSSEERTWLCNDSLILINDNHDIWLLEPSGIHMPVNITNGYGRSHHMGFKLLQAGVGLNSLSPKSHVVVQAFNYENKQNGFYSITLSLKKDPQLLTMGSFLYNWHIDGAIIDFPPVKAKRADIYVVRRMSATEYPNLYLTHDLKEYTPLTDFQPQRQYNWLTSQLIRWRTMDGRYSAGILYKPENFDDKKKYPIIFFYYEKVSDELNVFRSPKASEGDMNIPWFVSRGYLVFMPDIYYKIGYPGWSAFNSVVSAAHYLARFPWVNGRKMGIQGHSFGGFETNYLVAHTDIFVAACSAAGVCDQVSAYGTSVQSGGRTSYEMFWAEQGQGRIGVSLWQRPDLYITNSSILRADRITTPLLIMANKKDNNVPFSQSVELFMGLRRSNKKVWMLQYDNGGHEVGGQDAVDFTIRMTQFFDKYLKDAPFPKWMSEGIPAKMKGIESGFELEKK